MSQQIINPTPAVPAVFQFNSQSIRTVEKDGEPWFVAADVCAVLGIVWKGTTPTLNAIPEDWRGVSKLQTLHGNQHGTIGEREQELVVISEAATYKLAFRSNKPEADKFTNFISSEVIPSIRKHGHYNAAPQLPALPQTPMEMFLLAADAIKDLNSRTLQIESRTAQVEDVALDAISQVEEMKANQRLEPWQAFAIRQAMEVRVYELQEKYSISSRMLFSSCWGFIKRHFKVPTYSAIASRRYDEALMVVKNLTLEQLPPTIMELAKGSKRTLAKLGGAK